MASLRQVNDFPNAYKGGRCMSMLATEVLIVGAGPAGLATAISLAQAGAEFVLVDALPQAQNTSRAAVIHAATLQSLRRLGVAEPLIRQGIKVFHFRVRERDAVLFHGDFSVLPGPTPYALMIPQDETEAILIRLAHLGRRVVRPARLRGFERHGDGVCATVDGPDGVMNVEARFIVGADGEKSTVRSTAGISFPGQTYGSFLLWGSRFQVHHKLAGRFRAGPVLLVGDAAHVHSPAGGQGMNLGLRDAEALGVCLADVIKSNREADLDRYAAQRRVAAQKVLALTAHLTRLATVQAPLLRWTRNQLLVCAGALPMVRRAVAARIAGLE